MPDLQTKTKWNIGKAFKYNKRFLRFKKTESGTKRAIFILGKYCTSLFSVVHNLNTFTNNLNEDLKKINDWATQWKMSFNPDPTKQTQE